MLDLFRRDKDLFEDFFKEFDRPKSKVMKTDIKETDNAYTFLIDLPGFKKEDIKVSVERGYLVVSAISSSEIEDKKDNYIRRERSYGSMTRSYYVGDVSLDELKGKYDNGILEIEVPKDSTNTTSTKYLDIK